MAKGYFRLVVVLLLSFGYQLLYAREFPLPDNFKFDGHSDVHQFEPFIVPTVSWLQQTPLNADKDKRDVANTFVLNWLQRNPDINIGLPEYSLKFHDIDKQLLYLFMESWIKYTLETKDTNITDCSIAGIKSMLDYYNSGKAADLGKIDFLDKLTEISQSGKIKELFDTGRTAQNIWLYLKAPSSRKDFKYDENYFSFNFWSINLLHPRTISYRYMLEGYFDKWITTKDGSVTYPRLPPGDYTFRVQAAMNNDFSHAPEVVWGFTISQPVWKENWFLALLLLSGALLGYYIIKQREQNLKNIALLKHERILFEYEHLKSQVNPHFLFNSLNTLTHLIERDQVKAIEYSENLSSLYHSILTHYDNDLVLLSEEIAILENYFSIQKGRFGAALQLKMDIPPEVMSRKKIVPLAMQILIENVIKHNVISATDPLIIQIYATENEITIRNTISPKISKEKGKGMGLVNIKKRYELLTKSPVSYGESGNEFVVVMPLL